MVDSELMRKLVKSYYQEDDNLFELALMEIITDEKRKHNSALAKDLLHFIRQKSLTKTQSTLKPLNTTGNSLNGLIDIEESKKTFEDIILKPKTYNQINRVLNEFKNKQLLKIHNLSHKKKILLCGPPGCGKTLAAKVIAGELKLPFVYSRFDSLISSYLGETSTNLRKIFSFAEQGEKVVLFDEFDAIGKSRSDSQDHGELKRVVNSFLQILDSYDGDSIIIAATNHQSLLDSALWRRFDEIIYFDMPTNGESINLMKLKLQNFPYENINFDKMITLMKGFSHSDFEWICFNSIKEAILTNQDSVTAKLFRKSISLAKERHKIKRKKNGKI